MQELRERIKAICANPVDEALTPQERARRLQGDASEYERKAHWCRVNGHHWSAKQWEDLARHNQERAAAILRGEA